MWTCDTCGGDVATPEDGEIEWTRIRTAGGKFTGQGLRLVHAYKASPRTGHPDRCQYDSGRSVSNRPLSEMVGPDGLMRLLVMIHADEVPEEEALEMIKRIHIPGYEQARHYVDEAIAEGLYEPKAPPRFPNQNQINAILKYVRDSRK